MSRNMTFKDILFFIKSGITVIQGIWTYEQLDLIFSFGSTWDAPECGAERGLQAETGGTEAEGGAGEAEIQAERPNLLSQTQQLLRPDIPGVCIQVTLNIPNNNIKIVRNSMLPGTQGWASQEESKMNLKSPGKCSNCAVSVDLLS